SHHRATRRRAPATRPAAEKPGPVERDAEAGRIRDVRGGIVKLGAERKKLVLLAVLVAAAAMIFYVQLDSGPSAPSAAPLTGTSTPVKQSRSPAEELLGEGRPAAKVPRTAARNNEFRPSLKIKKGEGPPPEQRDPTLRTDLLAKVQS